MRRHLSPDQFIELAEGVLAESFAPHLETCDACRQQLADMRAMMSSAVEVDLPEPSPLFWEHLSERVRQAVALESPSRRQWWREPWSSPRVVVPLSAAALAAVLIVAVVGMRAGVGSSSPGSAAASEPAAVPEVALFAPLDAADDSSLSLVADLTAGLDWDAVSRIGLITHAGGVDEAVGELTSGELLELQRLLKEELARAGV